MIVDLTESHKISEKTIVVISDIHGHLDKLNDVIEQVAFHNAQLVFVGDYIDRGPNGIDVLKMVRQMEYNPKEWGFSKVVALKGNHEDMAVRAVSTGFYQDVRLWLSNGGRMEEFNSLKNDFRLWMTTLPIRYLHPKRIKFNGGTKDLVVTHGSIDPDRSFDHQKQEYVIWGREVRGWDEDTLVVNGHTPCESGKPEVYRTNTGPVIRIDTGAAYDGDVCGLLLEEV